MMKAYLNQLGIINALGATSSEVYRRLLASQAPGMRLSPPLLSGTTTWIGHVDAPLPQIPSHLARFNCRNNQLLAAAYESIRLDVDVLKQQYGANRIGIVLGTSTSGIAAGEAAIQHHAKHQFFPADFDYIQQEAGSCALFLADYAGISGIHYTISTACSSSGKAIAAGLRLLETHVCDAVIVGGADSLCEFTLNGFDALNLIATDRCHPFSRHRRGLNIGEGAALFILSKTPGPIALLGIGETTDGYHIATPDPQGTAAMAAMQQALDMAKLKPKDIGYINLHGTGTIKNDAAESTAIHGLFTHAPPCSSTKPLTGHTLGAASAIELGLCWLLLSQDAPAMLPPQYGDARYDPALLPLNIIREPTPWHNPVFMSNSFAFGGSNLSLIIGRGASCHSHR